MFKFTRPDLQMQEDTELGHAQLQVDSLNQSTLCRIVNRVYKIIKLPCNNNRSLFIFSDDNVLRKYARMIIEWGYPFFII